MSKIKEIIDAWDPIGLFPFCPEDEYHSEISQIECFISESKKEKDLGEYIFEVFIKSFGEKSFQRSITECRMIASKIIENGI